VTQSGETADTLGAVRRANAAGTRTLAVTNTVGSMITHETDNTAYIRAAPEIGVAVTKTFASQVVTLTMLAVLVGRDRGALGAADARSVLEDLRGLPGAVQQVLDEEETVRETAREYGDRKHSFPWASTRRPGGARRGIKLRGDFRRPRGGVHRGGAQTRPVGARDVGDARTRGVDRGGRRRRDGEQRDRGPDAGCVSAGEEYGTLDVSFSVPNVGVVEPLVANVYLQLFAYHVRTRRDGRSTSRGIWRRVSPLSKWKLTG